jgi:NitT/TauT family transport system permease protein
VQGASDHGQQAVTPPEFSDVAQVVAVMAVIVLIGTLADRLVFARIEKRVRTRFGLL